jgi:hypothetical protein
MPLDSLDAELVCPLNKNAGATPLPFNYAEENGYLKILFGPFCDKRGV